MSENIAKSFFLATPVRDSGTDMRSKQNISI